MNPRLSIWLLSFAVSSLFFGCTSQTRIRTLEVIPQEVQAGSTAQVKTELESPPSDPSELRFQWLAERGKIEPRFASAEPTRQYIAPNTPGTDRITVNLFSAGNKLLDVKSVTLFVTPGPSIGSINTPPQGVQAGATAEITVTLQNPPKDSSGLRIEGTGRGTLSSSGSETPLTLQYTAPMSSGQDILTFKLLVGNMVFDEKSIPLNVTAGPTIGSIEVTPESVQAGRTATVRVKLLNPPADANALRLEGRTDVGKIQSSASGGALALQYTAPMLPGEARVTLLLYQSNTLLDEQLIYIPITPGPSIRAITMSAQDIQAGETVIVRADIQNPPPNPATLRLEGSARRGQLQLTAEDMLAMTYIAPPTSGDDELTLQLFRGTVLLNERSITVEILPAYLLLEGFENEVGWRAGNAQDYPDAPGALRGERNNSDVSPMEGTYTYCMEVDTTQGDAVFEFLPQPPMDLSEYSTLTLDVYTPDPQVRLSLAITTGANWLWHESVIQDLPRPRDWNQLTFDLTAATYKVGSGSWDSPIRNLNIVQRLAVKIYGPQFTGKLYMDNLRGIKAEVSREP